MSGYDDVALAIALDLASEAIWHDGRCTWTGPVVERRAGRTVVAEHSLPPDLYGGTAGIGMVLAEVAALTGDRRCAETARAALRQSIARPDRIDPPMALGLFSGRAGIALAAVRTGLLLEAGDLVEQGHAMAHAVEAHGPAREAHDLVAGRAGAILALLAVAVAVDDVRLVKRAEDLGRDIIEAAGFRGAWSWRSDVPSGGLDITGLAHGVSGVCCALLELWAATGDDGFLAAAEDALAAEDRWFRAPEGNWVEDPGEDGPDRDRGEPHAMMSWCHGAPGIGLARHLAWRRTGDAMRRDRAGAAVRGTERWTRAAMGSLRGGFSLCHGIAGNAEIVRECQDAARPGDGDLAGLHEDVCRWGISEFHSRDLPWPDCPSPCLMTGRAGVARFYLRAHHVELPLVLMPGPDWFR